MTTQNERKQHMTDYLKKMFPYGHEDFIPMSIDEMELHSTKNHDYAFGGDPLGNLIRGSQILSLYPKLDLSDPTVYAMVLMLKQLDAALWMKNQGHIAKVEGIVARMTDVSVYSKIVCILEKRNSLNKFKSLLGPDCGRAKGEEIRISKINEHLPPKINDPYLRSIIDNDSMSE